jgi:hypothetical protein
MRVARGTRGYVECLLWRSGLPAEAVAEILAAADAYAKGPKTRQQGTWKPAVHYNDAGDSRPRAACRPGEAAARRWPLTVDCRDVTCHRCRASAAFLEAVRRAAQVRQRQLDLAEALSGHDKYRRAS